MINWSLTSCRDFPTEKNLRHFYDLDTEIDIYHQLRMLTPPDILLWPPFLDLHMLRLLRAVFQNLPRCSGLLASFPRYFLCFPWKGFEWRSLHLKSIHVRIEIVQEKRKMKRSDSVLWQKPLHPQKSKKQRDNTKTLTKTSITQQWRTNLGRWIWLTKSTQLVWLNRFTGTQPCH